MSLYDEHANDGRGEWPTRKVATLQSGTKSKEELWAEGPKHPVDPKFFWVTQTCDLIHPTQMRTSHLFNALKMIWNNSVPDRYKIQPFRKWGGIPKMQKDYKKKAVLNLMSELMNRPDVTPGMQQALKHMAAVTIKRKYNPSEY